MTDPADAPAGPPANTSTSSNSTSSNSSSIPSSPGRVSRRDLVKRQLNFLEDDIKSMTLSRRIAIHLMSNYKWYNPQLLLELELELAGEDDVDVQGYGDDDDSSKYRYHEMDDDDIIIFSKTNHMRERPSLAAAWAYFEHVTLPRYLDIHHDTTTNSNSDAGVQLQLVGQCGAEDEEWKEGDHHVAGRKEKAGLSMLVTCCYWQEIIRHSLQRLHQLVRGDNNNGKESKSMMDLSEPGENRYPTKLYSPLHTPLDQMGDFGLGVGLYFTALRSLALLSLLAGLFNIPNMLYYASENYSENGQRGYMASLRGSAVCTAGEFVPCPSCSIDDFADAPSRVATVAQKNAHSYYYNGGGGDDDLVFVKKNYCDGAQIFPLALINYATLLLVAAGMVVISKQLKAQEIKFDEDEQTAQDYSVVIRNPPKDAIDPSEWREFFVSTFGVHVTCCTVGRDNHLLVRALVRRREILQKLKWSLPPGTRLDENNVNNIAVRIQEDRSMCEKAKALIAPGVPELVTKLGNINAIIRKLSTRNFPATKVFVTFETEAAQRKILNHLSVGSGTFLRRSDSLRAKHPDHLFRSKVVLNVKEAPEPSTVRWHDLSTSKRDRFFKVLLSTYAWACIFLLVAFVVRLCRDRNANFAAYAIAFFNMAFPELAKVLVGFESHPSEGGRQTSLYVKIAAFRWIMTAVVMTSITPFTLTLSGSSDSMLDGVSDIFFAEILTTNCVKLINPMGQIRRHYLAPRAESQEEMNSHMRGEDWDLAERYTSMTNLFFLAVWYCAIYPFGFFYCAGALFINYFTDSFSLMRSWRQAPRLGAHISQISRRYFFTMAISAMATASSYIWAGFPYDNLCSSAEGDNDDSLASYIGNWVITTIDGSISMEVTVAQGDQSFRFCQQSLYWYGKGFNFPAIPYWQKKGDEWMTAEQEFITSIYGMTSFILLLVVCIWVLRKSYYSIFYRSNYEACGEDQGIDFSDVASISSYIPEVKSDLFPYPLLAVDADDVDDELYEWKDPDKPYSFYDLTRDFSQILSGSTASEKSKSAKSVFSQVKHWPPTTEPS